MGKRVVGAQIARVMGKQVLGVQVMGVQVVGEMCNGVARTQVKGNR